MDAKKQIFEVIVKHLRQNVEGLDEQEIDGTQSMMVYGATSLDLVEIVSSATRELRLSVPRAQLSGVKSINELVDLFARIQSQRP